MVKIYCIEDFKRELESLRKNKSYRAIDQDIINYFFDKEISQISSGTNLNTSLVAPFIKKRLEGSGGYRIYFLLIIKEDKAYLMFIHPKTGSDGYENIAKDTRKDLYKKVLSAIQEQDLYELSCNPERSLINFKKVKVSEKTK